jgi:tetratricopeptide (TPR) repeat protein
MNTFTAVLKIIAIAVLPLLAAFPAAAQPTTDFQQAVAAYQQSPSDAAAERVIKLAAAMDQAPPIPEEAREPFVMGQTMFKSAKSPNDFAMAGREFGEAVHVAPWWPEAHYNRALALEAAGDYPGGIAALRLYLLFKLPDAEARTAQDKIYALKAKQKMAEQEKEMAEAQARESSPEAVAAREQEQFLRKVDGAQYRFDWNNTNYSTIEIRNGTVLTEMYFGNSYGQWTHHPETVTFELNGKRLRGFLHGVACPTLTGVISEDGSIITIHDGNFVKVYNRVR